MHAIAPVVKIRGPVLYPKQYDAIFDPARFSFIEASTKAGKTAGCIAWQFAQCCKRIGEHWWVAPIRAQAKIAFKRAKKLIPRDVIKKINQTELTIELVNGSIWAFKGSDNPDSLYGEDVYSAVIDEASRCKEDAWKAIRSTLTATRGACRIIGNVKGRKNWFWRLARRAEAGAKNYAYHKLTAYDAIQGGVLDAAEIAQAKQDLPEDVFNELYLAIGTVDGSNPFGIRAIRQAVIGVDEQKLIANDYNLVDKLDFQLAPGPVVAWGIDLAKSTDWTVLVGLNEDGDVCEFWRYQKSWRDTISHIRQVVDDDEALVDSTGVGDPVLEELQGEDVRDNFDGFNFSNARKQQLMEGLAVALQQQQTRYPDGVMRMELEEFEYEYSGRIVRYSAPEGMHDDCVCAYALAWAKYKTRTELAWWN